MAAHEKLGKKSRASEEAVVGRARALWCWCWCCCRVSSSLGEMHVCVAEEAAARTGRLLDAGRKRSVGGKQASKRTRRRQPTGRRPGCLLGVRKESTPREAASEAALPVFLW